jgi:hypothetical protein
MPAQYEKLSIRNQLEGKVEKVVHAQSSPKSSSNPEDLKKGRSFDIPGILTSTTADRRLRVRTVRLSRWELFFPGSQGCTLL